DVVPAHPSPAGLASLSLHAALPICQAQQSWSMRCRERPTLLRLGGVGLVGAWAGRVGARRAPVRGRAPGAGPGQRAPARARARRAEEHTSELQSRFDLVCRLLLENK